VGNPVSKSQDSGAGLLNFAALINFDDVRHGGYFTEVRELGNGGIRESGSKAIRDFLIP